MSVWSMIIFPVAWNNCFTDITSWFLVNRRILHIVSTKMNCSLVCDVDEYTPKSVVLVEVIQVIRWTSAVNLSYDRIDFLHVRYNCWRHMKNLWPFSASSFRIPWISWISGCNRFPCYFFLMFAPWFRFRKFPWFLTFICRGKFLRHIQPSNRQSMHLSAFLENSTLRRVLDFFLPSRVRFPCRCCEYPWAFSTQSGGSRMRNSRLDVRFIAVGFNFATILSSSFCSSILFAVVLGKLVKLKFWSQQVEAEMDDVEQMKKIVPLITCEITFGQYVCQLMFGVDVPNLNLGFQINPHQTTNPEQPCGFLTHVSLLDFCLSLSS